VTQQIYPATGQTGTGNGYTQYDYQYPGGPVADTKLYDESGNLVRQVTYTYTAEGELASVTGSTQPATPK